MCLLAFTSRSTRKHTAAPTAPRDFANLRTLTVTIAQKHPNALGSRPLFACPAANCAFTTTRKNNLKRNLSSLHPLICQVGAATLNAWISIGFLQPSIGKASKLRTSSLRLVSLFELSPFVFHDRVLRLRTLVTRSLQTLRQIQRSSLCI
jgi:hypothetical protein